MAEAPNLKMISLSPTRKIIRERMEESARIPQFILEIPVEMEKIFAVKKNLESSPSITTILIWCCGQALKSKPELNGYYIDNQIALAQEINIGMAVSIPGGLIVPVIPKVAQKNLTEVAQEVALLLEKIKKKRLSPDDVAGGTFTISNLGMYGIAKFIPLINPPQIVIMGIGGLINGFRMVNQELQSYQYFNVTLAVDHRALDGAVAAEFLVKFKEVCENLPLKIN